ncbi:MaoC family dehydratase N-terminal domain-containing protein [Roseomonas sp. OT10]|uniref:FAS1-like dehydratase domain-containing protein n=1 Tax=Roseomonas cutis TaxID=2897332 RepID=UPI001E55ABF4|nr:MaoC family dehydratase N-terminal domain-containing protein [Roseomonas sp. OT10]UFN49484.1 MaoC family dehydratase N-terminal domain-containing protein [Roseomonas sp. OT10]
MGAETALDIDHLRGWVGRGERATDTLTPRLVQGLRATLDGDAALPADGEAAPATAHWCLAPPTVAMSGLGPDGHPARGGFLPPVPLPRRMWAGGALVFHHPLLVGDVVERESRIVDLSVKEGRTGRLCFVTVEHRILSPRGLALEERHDIVYRDMDRAPAAPPAASPATSPARRAAPEARVPQWRRVVQADPVLLFRYSALTFNGHRIHYDRAYCIEEEGYPGLVVHGPLQATLLVELAAEAKGGQPPRRFEFRGVRPLFDGAAFSVNAAEAEGGLDLWTADAAGHTTMTAMARW